MEQSHKEEGANWASSELTIGQKKIVVNWYLAQKVVVYWQMKG